MKLFKLSFSLYPVLSTLHLVAGNKDSHQVPIYNSNDQIVAYATNDLKKDVIHYSRLAGVSYCDDGMLKSWECGFCKELPNEIQHKSYFDKKHNLRALLIVDHTYKEIVLTLRGTMACFKNVLRDLNFFKIGFEDGKVHTGFFEGSQILVKLYRHDLKKHLEKHPTYRLVITGHSLGGAMAVLSAAILTKELGIKWEKIFIVTYSQPKIGDIKFNNWLVQHPFEMIRVSDKSDLIARTPPKIFGYRQLHPTGNAKARIIVFPTVTQSGKGFLKIISKLDKAHNLVLGTRIDVKGCRSESNPSSHMHETAINDNCQDETPTNFVHLKDTVTKDS